MQPKQSEQTLTFFLSPPPPPDIILPPKVAKEDIWLPYFSHKVETVRGNIEKWGKCGGVTIQFLKWHVQVGSSWKHPQNISLITNWDKMILWAKTVFVWTVTSLIYSLYQEVGVTVSCCLRVFSKCHLLHFGPFKSTKSSQVWSDKLTVNSRLKSILFNS